MGTEVVQSQEDADYVLPEAAERWFAETIGDLFSITAKQGYDSE